MDAPSTETAIFSSGVKSSFLAQIEDSFFFVLYVMHEKTKGSNVHPNIVVTVAEMVASFVHLGGFILSAHVNFGNLTLSWGQVIVFLQFRTPYRPGYYSPDFQIAFWFMIIVSLIVVGISVVVAISFHRRSFQHTWPLRVLNFIIAVFIRFFVVSALSVLLTPVFCDPKSNTLHAFHQVVCFSDMLEFIVGIGSSIVLLVFVLAYNLSEIEHELVPNSLLTTTTPHFNVSLLVITVIFIILGDYMGEAIVGEWFKSFAFLVLLLFLTLLLIFKIPYQNYEVCAFRAGTLTSLNWLSFLAFLSMHMEPNPLKENRALDYILILGLIPSFVFGMYLVSIRKKYIEHVCHQIVLKHRQLTKQLLAATDISSGKPDGIHHKESEIIEKFSTEPLIQAHIKSINNVEIIGRFLMQMKQNKIGENWYRAAILHHPVSALTHILHYIFLDDQGPEKNKEMTNSATEDWDSIYKLEPYFYLRFICFKKKMEKDKQSQTANIASNGDELDLLQYVEFRKSYQLAKKYHARCIDAIQQFWILFLGRNLTFRSFQLALRTINTNTKMADTFYKNLLSRYPKAAHILNAYSNFAALVLNDGEEADHYHQLSLTAQVREAEMQSEVNGGVGTLGIASNGVVLTINMEGIIQEITASALQLFGYSKKSDLVHRKINVLMPFPYKLNHDHFLERYKKTGVKNVIGVKQTFYALHKLGYVFFVDIQIVEFKRREVLFAGSLTPHPPEKEPACICINKEGLIEFVTKPCIDMFGYTPNELIGKNVEILMAKEYAYLHNMYLKNYIETGEARAIGQGMRNVMGLHKSGKFIAIGISLEKLYVAGEIYFVGTMVNMEDLLGEIIINAHGDIVTCNENITRLLGYSLSELNGNNIKMIMPEPYASFHDTYLERYKRTKKGLLVDSPQGRNLIVKHKNGTCFHVHLVVKKLENTSEPLYQGFLHHKIMQEDTKNGEIKSNVISISPKFIIEAHGAAVTKLLQVEYGSIVNKSIEIVFPSCNLVTYQSDVWSLIRFLLDNPDTYHYVYYLKPNGRLHPCAVMAQEENDGTITLIVEDLMSKEGLIRINELSMVQDINNVIPMLFGYSEDEILGKNVSMLMPFSIAKEHDTYIRKYIESKEKKVIGISRSLMGKNKDEINFPIVLEVIEKNVDGEREFMARIRHGIAPLHKLSDQELAKLKVISEPPTSDSTSLFNQEKAGTDTPTVKRQDIASFPPTSLSEPPSSSAFLSPNTSLPQLTKPSSRNQRNSLKLDTPVKSALKLHSGSIRTLQTLDDDRASMYEELRKMQPTMEEEEELMYDEANKEKEATIGFLNTSGRSSLTSKIKGGILEEEKKDFKVKESKSTVRSDSDDMSDTNSTHSQNTASLLEPQGNVRDKKLIMLWKNSKSNPLHITFEKRQMRAAIMVCLIMLLSIILGHVMNYGGIDTEELSYFAGYIKLNQFYASMERYLICQRNNQTSFCTALPDTNWSQDWATFFQEYSTLVVQMHNAHTSHPAQLITYPDLPILRYIYPNENVAETTYGDFWELNKDILSAISSLSLNASMQTRNLNFLLNNKYTIMNEYPALLHNVIQVQYAAIEASTIILNAAIGLIIVVVLTVFLGYSWGAFLELNRERSKALALIMDIPKVTIYDLAYKVYDPDNELEDSETSTADDLMDLRNLNSDQVPDPSTEFEEEVKAVEPNNNVTTTLVSVSKKRKGKSMEFIHAKKVIEKSYQTDVRTPILIILLYSSILLLPLSLIFVQDLYYNLEVYKFLYTLSDFVDLYTVVTPLSHQIMDPTLGFMSDHQRAMSLTALSNAKRQLSRLQWEVISDLQVKELERLFLQKKCFAKDGCNSMEMEGTGEGLSLMLYVLTEKVTLLFRDQGELSTEKLAELQTYLIRFTTNHLLNGLSTFTAQLAVSFNALNQLSGTIILDMQIVMILLAGIAFLAMHFIQRNMREDIKQNCLLLLMIPQNVINKQKNLKRYIRKIAEEIKRKLGTQPDDIKEKE